MIIIIDTRDKEREWEGLVNEHASGTKERKTGFGSLQGETILLHP
jgi:hypothetical protein